MEDRPRSLARAGYCRVGGLDLGMHAVQGSPLGPEKASAPGGRLPPCALVPPTSATIHWWRYPDHERAAQTPCSPYDPWCRMPEAHREPAIGPGGGGHDQSRALHGFPRWRVRWPLKVVLMPMRRIRRAIIGGLSALVVSGCPFGHDLDYERGGAGGSSGAAPSGGGAGAAGGEAGPGGSGTCVPNPDPCPSNQCAGTASDDCGGTVNCTANCGLAGECPCAGGACSGKYCSCNPGPCI